MFIEKTHELALILCDSSTLSNLVSGFLLIQCKHCTFVVCLNRISNSLNPLVYLNHEVTRISQEVALNFFHTD